MRNRSLVALLEILSTTCRHDLSWAGPASIVPERAEVYLHATLTKKNQWLYINFWTLTRFRAMPGPKSLFGKKTSFVPKKSAPARRSSSLTSLNRLDESTYSAADLKVHLSGDPESASKSIIRLRLGESELAFDREEGNWFLENSSGGGSGGGATRASAKELTRLRKQNQQLIEENNLLKYRLEVMLDMLVASSADANAQSRDLQALRKRS